MAWTQTIDVGQKIPRLSWSQILHQFRNFWQQITSVIFITLSIEVLLLSHNLQPSDEQCVHRFSSWSPALDVVKHHWTHFPNNHPLYESPYFNPTPSQGIEDAWDSLLPSEQILTSFVACVIIYQYAKDGMLTCERRQARHLAKQAPREPGPLPQ